MGGRGPLSVAVLLLLSSPALGFIRGDANANGTLSLVDVMFTLNHLFVPGSPDPPCLDALDVNDDGVLDLPDPLLLATFLFLQGAPPLPPYPNDGDDPTPDSLGDCPSAGEILPFEVLVDGQHSGFLESSDPDFCALDPVLFSFILREEAEWSAFWAQHTNPVSNPPPIPVVDFSENNVIVVLASVNTGGYHVTVDVVTEFLDRVEVNLTVVEPDGCGTLPVCSQPHQFLLVPVIQTDGDAELLPTSAFPCL